MTQRPEKTPRLSEDQTRESDPIESMEQSIMTEDNIFRPGIVESKIEEIKDVLSKIADQVNSRDFESLTDPDHMTLLAYLDQSIAYLSPKTPSLSDFESLVSSLEETAVSLRRLSSQYVEIESDDHEFDSLTWKTMIKISQKISSLETTLRYKVKESEELEDLLSEETEETDPETEESEKTYDHNWLDSDQDPISIMLDNIRVRDSERVKEKIETFSLQTGDQLIYLQTSELWIVKEIKISDNLVFLYNPYSETRYHDLDSLLRSLESGQIIHFEDHDHEIKETEEKTEDPNSDPESEIFTLEIGDLINSKFHILTIWRVSEIDPETETVSLHNDLTGESLRQSFGSLLTSYKICLLQIKKTDGRQIVKDYRDNTVLKIGDRLSSEDFTKRSKTWKDQDFGSLSDRIKAMVKETDGLLSFYLRTLEKTEDLKDSDSDDLYLEDLKETLEDFETDSKTIRSFGLEIERRSDDLEDSEKDYLNQFSEVLTDTLLSVSSRLYILSSTEDPDLRLERVKKIGLDLIFLSRITEDPDSETADLIDNIWLSSNIWSKDPEDWKTSKTMRETVSIIKDLIKYIETLTLERYDLTIMDSLIIIALYRGLKDLIDKMSDNLSDVYFDRQSFSVSDSEIVSRYLILISSLSYLHSDLETISETREFDATIETYTQGLTVSMTRVRDDLESLESVFELTIKRESDLDRVFQGLEIVSLTSIFDLLSSEKREIVRDLIDTIKDLDLEETEDLIETVSLLFRLVYLQGQYFETDNPDEIEKDDLQTLRKTQDQIGSLSIRLQSQIFSQTPEKESETADLEDSERLTPETVRQSLMTLRDDLNSDSGDSEVFRLEIISDRLFGIGQDLGSLYSILYKDPDQYNLTGDSEVFGQSVRSFMGICQIINNSGHDMTKINTRRLTRRLDRLINLLTERDPETLISEVLISIAKIGQSESILRGQTRILTTKTDTLINCMTETRSRLFDGRLYNAYAKDSEERDRLFETLEEIEDLKSEILRLTRVSEDLIVRVSDLPYSFSSLSTLEDSEIDSETR